MSYLCITVRWADDRYHGLVADRRPEWPPSPLRLFQALLASACRKHPDGSPKDLESLTWLQNDSSLGPMIIAPKSQLGRAYARYVPNNDSDQVLIRQKRLAEKFVSPTLLLDQNAIHYVWAISKTCGAEELKHAERICALSLGIVAFGWGVDMASGSGAIVTEGAFLALSGERWIPNNAKVGNLLRIPSRETLPALQNQHQKFLNRLCSGHLSDVPKLSESAFRTAAYCRATDHAAFPFAAFSLLKMDAAGFQPFDTARRGCSVATMARHATNLVAPSANWWSKQKMAELVLGHAEPLDAGTHQPVPESRRFAYLPLPSIQYRGANRSLVVGGIRRLMITSFNHQCAQEIAWVRRALSNQNLVPDEAGQSKDPVALLSMIPQDDLNLRPYVQQSTDWASVTPVVLPGFDDHGRLRKRAMGEDHE